jgi:hypothetical protein
MARNLLLSLRVETRPLTPWQDSEMGWKALAEDLPVAPPPRPVEKAVQKVVEKKAKPAVFDDTMPLPIKQPRGWRLMTPEAPMPTVPEADVKTSTIRRLNASEQRLWRIAGGLMVLAVAVIAVLGAITLWPTGRVAAPMAAVAVAATAPSVARKDPPLARKDSAQPATPHASRSAKSSDHHSKKNHHSHHHLAGR